MKVGETSVLENHCDQDGERKIRWRTRRRMMKNCNQSIKNHKLS